MTNRCCKTILKIFLWCIFDIMWLKLYGNGKCNVVYCFLGQNGFESTMGQCRDDQENFGNGNKTITKKSKLFNTKHNFI